MTSRVLAIACATAALALGSMNSAKAQVCDQLCLPNGTPVTCQVLPNGSKVWVDAAGNTYPGNTSGTGSFAVTQCDPAVCQLQLKPTALNITSQAGPLGVIQTSLDNSRTSSLATLTQNAAGTYTEKFSFYVTATSSAYPGIQFQSIQELTFQSNNVSSFNPHQNEQFDQVAPVDFEDPANPGVIVFSLSSATITLN